MGASRPFRVEPEHRSALTAAGLADLDACLGFSGGELVKAALPGRDVRRVGAGERVYYLKRVLGAGWRDVVTEARALERLGAAGLPVARIAAAGARWRAGVLVTESLPAARTLERLLLDGELPAARLRVLAKRVAELLRRLHQLGTNHRDFYCGHLLVDDDDQVFLVDLGRAQTRRSVPWRWRIKDLAALDCSIPPRVAARALRLRFFAMYLGDELDRRQRRRRLAAIAAKSRRYLRHSEREVARGKPNIHVNA